MHQNEKFKRKLLKNYLNIIPQQGCQVQRQWYVFVFLHPWICTPGFKLQGEISGDTNSCNDLLIPTDMSLTRSFPFHIIHDYDTSPKNDLHCCRIICTGSNCILFYKRWRDGEGGIICTRPNCRNTLFGRHTL